MRYTFKEIPFQDLRNDEVKAYYLMKGDAIKGRVAQYVPSYSTREAERWNAHPATWLGWESPIVRGVSEKEAKSAMIKWCEWKEGKKGKTSGSFWSE